MCAYERIWAHVWVHMGEYERIWVHMDASGRIWAHMNAYGRIWLGGRVFPNRAGFKVLPENETETSHVVAD